VSRAPDKENPVRAGRRARLTVVHRHCIRIEDNPEGRFVDAPSLFACRRETPAAPFTLKRKGAELVLDTGAIELRYRDDGQPLGPDNLSARIRRGSEWTAWRPGQENGGNLGGTAETLDGWRGPRRLPHGLLSRDGWFLLDDSAGPLIEDGWVASRGPRGCDWYLFGYGTDYRAAFQAFAAVAGPVPLPRRYALGAWYSRYWPYSSDDYRRIVQEYDERDFPLDVMVMDMDWHINDVRRTRNAKGTGGGQVWTGYTWDRELLPDAEELLAWFHRQGLRVTLNDHPADGVQPHEAMYEAFMQEMDADPKAEKALLFDAGSRSYLDTFYRHTHEPLEQAGVDFWWLDWQQYPFTRSVSDVKNLQWLNHYYYGRSRRESRRGQSFSRWGGWGDHRHPIHFSGDAYTNWEMLAFEVPFTATAGNAGCFFWSHDIGGHQGGRNEESYTRWCQFGALSAALRSHSTRDATMDRRPWTYPDWAEASMRRSFHLRAELFPYIYSSAAQSCRDTVPMVRPMYLDHPEAEAAYRNPQQYLLGDHVLAAPIAEPGIGPRRLGRQAVWFPQGWWYDAFTGERFEGPCERLVAAEIDEFPVYVRGGAPLPTQPYTQRMTSAPLAHLVLRCWPGEDGQTKASEIYEDDGVTEGYTRGESARTRVTCVRTGDRLTVRVAATEGAFEGQLARRRVIFEVGGIEAPRGATVDGRPVQAVYDAVTRTARVDAGERSIRDACECTVTATVADPANAAAAAFARRVGLPPPTRDETVHDLFARIMSEGDGSRIKLALRAAGIGLFPRHESPYGFPDEARYFVYAPDGFGLEPAARLRLGTAETSVTLAGTRTPLDVAALRDRIAPPAGELLFGGETVELALHLRSGNVSCADECRLEAGAPWWRFTANLAPHAKATASTAMADQPAAGAVDGVVGGIPGNPAHEWASRKERAGAWLKLEWPEAVTVGRVLLFDRPNRNDHVVAGRLVLSDGTVHEVGELPSDGKTPFELRITPRQIRWLVFMVTDVSKETGWVGLSEIAVYSE
jgi:hypothetical protein